MFAEKDEHIAEDIDDKVKVVDEMKRLFSSVAERLCDENEASFDIIEYLNMVANNFNGSGVLQANAFTVKNICDH